MNDKNSPHQITVAEMSPHVHVFYAGENRVQKIANWIAEWIKNSLETGKIKPYDFLPLKGDLAFHIGVSKGTIQNAYRILEDMGLVESKQRIGTYVTGNNKTVSKLTSKRDSACAKLKSYIKENLSEGENLGTLSHLSKKIKISVATLRSAIDSLIEKNIIEKRGKVFVINRTDFEVENISTRTLVVKISEDIKKYISKNLKTGDKIPSNPDLAKKYNVSIKTIYDAVKILANEGIVYSRRGKYGTVVINSNSEPEEYMYERFAAKLKEYISKNCKIGSKLPPIRELAKNLKTSQKTVKNALDELSLDGYLTFVRGRYGGTFVTDIPKNDNDAYTWLAISSDYIQNTEN